MGRGIASRIIACVLVANVVDSIPIVQDGDTGKPLYLTPFLKDGRVIEAREASRVPSMIEHEDVESYAGFLTVNEEFESNMFFWFFPAENNRYNAPVVLWLQGGPGASSLYAIFNENGPFYITQDSKLERRDHSWSQDMNMIYIDNPVGVGFSYTNDDNGYVTDETDVGRDLYEALTQFFQLFPEYRRNGFFIAGESYAGKYIPALAHTIHENNSIADEKINLKGIAIGNGFVDPRNMMAYGEYLYQHGLTDDNFLATMKILEQNTVKFIDEKDFYNATKEYWKILGALYETMGPIDQYDYLKAGVDDMRMYTTSTYLNQSAVRRSLHVGDLSYVNTDMLVKMQNKLHEDITKSVAPWLEELMDKYRVLLYNGQLDTICAYPLTINYVRKLKWSGADEYLKAPRKQWFVGKDLAGFTKTVGNFTEVLVRNAGHMVPADQPLWALDLITRFTNNIPFDQPLS